MNFRVHSKFILGVSLSLFLQFAISWGGGGDNDFYSTMYSTTSIIRTTLDQNFFDGKMFRQLIFAWLYFRRYDHATI